MPMSSLNPTLKSALRRLRAARSRRPPDSAGPVEFAEWRDDIAAALEELARVLLFEEDRVQASREAKAARAQAARLRAAAGVEDG